MLTILIRKETRRELEALEDDDILIRPDLGEYGSTNFSQIDETIAPGAEATMAMTSELRGLVLERGTVRSTQSWQRYSGTRFGRD